MRDWTERLIYSLPSSRVDFTNKKAEVPRDCKRLAPIWQLVADRSKAWILVLISVSSAILYSSSYLYGNDHHIKKCLTGWVLQSGAWGQDGCRWRGPSVTATQRRRQGLTEWNRHLEGRSGSSFQWFSVHQQKMTELMSGGLPQPCTEDQTCPRSPGLLVTVRQSLEEPLGHMVRTVQWKPFCAKFNVESCCDFWVGLVYLFLNGKHSLKSMVYSPEPLYPEPMCTHTSSFPSPAHPGIIKIRKVCQRESALRTCSSIRALQFPARAGAVRCGVRLEKQFVLC